MRQALAGVALLASLAARSPQALAADTIIPSLTITAPGAGAAIAASGATFAGTATDNVAVVKVRIYVYDETRSRFTVSNANAAFTAATRQWRFAVQAAHVTAGGAARLWAQAQDAQGNVSPWQGRRVQVAGSLPPSMVDVTAPVLTITAPADNALVPASGVVFSGTATDAVGVSKVNVYVYDLGRQVYAVSNAQADYSAQTGAWSFPVQQGQLSPGGSARLWARAQDAAGNASAWQSVAVSVPNAASALGFSRVRVVGRQLIVEKRQKDGTLAAPQAFKVRGVAYSPVDLGETINTRSAARQHLRESRYREDFAAMEEQLGANAVKTYVDAGTDDAALTFLDEAYSHGLMVAVTLDIDATEVASVVNAYKNHPAVLCWIIGNEWNLNGFFRGLSLSQAAVQVEQTAQQIHALDSNHPVASSLGFLPVHFNMGPEIVSREFPAILAATPSVDLWSLNVYRGGESFDPIFFEWSLLSSKPFFFGEFGTDDWDASAGGVDEWTQANTLFNLWDEIHRQMSINQPARQCVGGFVFEWNDEWWKMGNPTVQESQGFSIERTITQSLSGIPLADFRAHPDGVANEEHFGITTLSRQPKQAFWVLREAFGLGTLRTQDVSLSVQAAGNGNLGYVVFSKREAPVFVSEKPGIHLISVARDTGNVAYMRRFDTAANPQSECAALLAAVQSIPEKDVVLAAISQNALPMGASFASPALSGCAGALALLGAKLALQVQPQEPWALIAVAGAVPSNLAEQAGGLAQPADAAAVVPLDADRDGTADLFDSDNDNDGRRDDWERVLGRDVLDSSF